MTVINSFMLEGKVAIVTGGAGGIGRVYGRALAEAGAAVVLADLDGAAADQEAAKLAADGHDAMGVAVDITDPAAAAAMAEAATVRFGGIDILVNNASAIDLRGIEALDMKRYDLMQQVNARGSYLCAKLALPHLKKAANPHILTLSPPLDLNPKWFSPNLAYTTAKYGMSLVTLGLARALARDGVAVNSLWPETAIATAAVGNLLGGEAALRRSRKADIVADAAQAILTRPAKECSGNFFIDSLVLGEEGVTDFAPYAVDPSVDALLDFFLEKPFTKGVSPGGFHPDG